MKLKKIVSLALAGVLAVSMLAGCADNKTDDNTVPDEGTAASGYSAMLAKELDELDDEDYITFKDNSTDQTALKSMVNAVANSTLNTAKGKSATAVESSTTGFEAAVKSLTNKADLDAYLDGTDEAIPAATLVNADVKTGIVYMADASISMEDTIKAIASDLETNHKFTTTDLVESDKDTQGEIGFDYDYVISVSVVNVPNSADLNASFSVNFILVTITRTAE